MKLLHLWPPLLPTSTHLLSHDPPHPYRSFRQSFEPTAYHVATRSPPAQLVPAESLAVNATTYIQPLHDSSSAAPAAHIMLVQPAPHLSAALVTNRGSPPTLQHLSWPTVSAVVLVLQSRLRKGPVPHLNLPALALSHLHGHSNTPLTLSMLPLQPLASYQHSRLWTKSTLSRKEQFESPTPSYHKTPTPLNGLPVPRLLHPTSPQACPWCFLDLHYPL